MNLVKHTYHLPLHIRSRVLHFIPFLLSSSHYLIFTYESPLLTTSGTTPFHKSMYTTYFFNSYHFHIINHFHIHNKSQINHTKQHRSGVRVLFWYIKSSTQITNHFKFKPFFKTTKTHLTVSPIKLYFNNHYSTSLTNAEQIWLSKLVHQPIESTHSEPKNMCSLLSSTSMRLRLQRNNRTTPNWI
jgi:hypothetical protein